MTSITTDFQRELQHAAIALYRPPAASPETYALCAVVAMMKYRDLCAIEWSGIGHAMNCMNQHDVAVVFAAECLNAHNAGVEPAKE